MYKDVLRAILLKLIYLDASGDILDHTMKEESFMGKNSTINTPLRIFISSTYEDMVEYREAVANALNSIEQLPIGMEHFVSSPEKSLEVCLSDVRRCQIYILLIGMRYGSIDIDTGKSYTELEYEEARKYNIPVLAFVIDESKCAILPKYVDVGEKAKKLADFKEKLDSEHLVSRFESIDNLKTLVIQAVESQIDRINKITEEKKESEEQQYISGSKLFKRFLLLPDRYTGTEAILRVRMDGKFSTWMRKDCFFEAFDVKVGDTIIGGDTYVLGVNMEDIDQEGQYVDFYAEGKEADWILDNEISTGVVFEAKFRFAYETVKLREDDNNPKVAALILLDGICVVGKMNSSKRKR